MTVVNGDILRIACRTSGSSGEVINVYHVRANFVAPQSDSDVTDALVDYVTTSHAVLNPWIHFGISPVDVKIDVVDWIGSPQKETVVRSLGIFSWGAAFNPTASGDDLPPGVCALVKFRTTGVRTLLRKFIGVLAEMDRSGGGWVGGFVTSLTNYAVSMLVGAQVSVGNDLFYGSWSKRAASFVNAAGYVVSLTEAYQRRRKFGVGA